MSDSISLGAVFRLAVYYGVAGFGGGYSVLAQLRRDLVSGRKWLTEEDFLVLAELSKSGEDRLVRISGRFVPEARRTAGPRAPPTLGRRAQTESEQSRDARSTASRPERAASGQVSSDHTWCELHERALQCVGVTRTVALDTSAPRCVLLPLARRLQPGTQPG